MIFASGIPPYQRETKNNGRQSPVYNEFMDAAYDVAECVELITPARFLFEAGQTPKAWNKKMLNDKHLKVLHYEANAAQVFSNTEIKGGVAITIRDDKRNYGPITTFTAFHELNNIVKSVSLSSAGQNISSIISVRGCYRTTEQFFEDYPIAKKRLGKGTGNMIASNFFEKMPEVYKKKKPASGEWIKMLSRINGKREFCYFSKKYVQQNEFIDGFNVACPKSNGNGVFGEVLTSTEILCPDEGATDTFISIGSFSTQYEAIAMQNYMKTKFFRALLGVKKVTQDNPKSVWELIPLQDFTENSDINWGASIAEIDQQLYKKYGLSEEEINFIETHVKEMK